MVLTGLLLSVLGLFAVAGSLPTQAWHNNNLGLNNCWFVEMMEDYRHVPRDLSNDCRFVFRNQGAMEHRINQIKHKFYHELYQPHAFEPSVYNNAYWEVWNVFNVEYPHSS